MINNDHWNLIQLCHDSIIDKCIKDSKLCIPYTCNKSDGKPSLVGWNELVKPYKEAFIYWYYRWK